MSFPLSRLLEAYTGELAALLPGTGYGSVDRLACVLLVSALGLPDRGYNNPDSMLSDPTVGAALDAQGTGGSRQASAALLLYQELAELAGRALVPDGGTGNAQVHTDVT